MHNRLYCSEKVANLNEIVVVRVHFLQNCVVNKTRNRIIYLVTCSFKKYL